MPRQVVACLLPVFVSGHCLGAGALDSNVAPPELYGRNCAMCHESGISAVSRTSVFGFRQLGAAEILQALTTGVMKGQGQRLSDAERRALATYLAEDGVHSGETPAPPILCDRREVKVEPPTSRFLEGWGFSLTNSRSIDETVTRVSQVNVGRLRLSWVFAFPGATRARSQPLVAWGTIFVGSQDGTVYALDLETGCIRWRFSAEAEVRVAPSAGLDADGAGSGSAYLYFGDVAGNAYKVSVTSGKLRWKVHVDATPYATITGSPRLYGQRLYVPMSSNEWAAAAVPGYRCCRFRGSVVAIDTGSGRIIWRSFMTLASGVAGAPVWSSPTIDVKRNRLYVGTGQSYTSPAASQSDSIVALDLDSGAQVWSRQMLSGDAWNLACVFGPGGNCPRENGPDLDVGAPPILQALRDGKDILLVGQKSGDVAALDPDASGRLIWKVKVGRGGFAGGVHWGMASVTDALYVPISDKTVDRAAEAPRPGIYALDPASGAIQWSVQAPDVCSAEQIPRCDRGYSAPATAIPGAVLAPALDGWLRAYDGATGRLLWQFNTARSFRTVSGEFATGGSIESAGSVAVGDNLVVSSGYGYFRSMAGSLLLVFGLH